MRLLPCGDRALLVELSQTDERRRLDAHLRAARPHGIVEHVPADRTVLVRVAAAADLQRVADELRALDLAGVAAPSSAPEPAEPFRIPVRYDGPDLDEVAGLLSTSREEVIARHTGRAWLVDFIGFAPGFAYLVDETGREDLVVPRRDSPRTRVNAGSVGLAGSYSGVYPSASPGGWQLIGTTELPLWDPVRDPPALLQPGLRVRFEEAP